MGLRNMQEKLEKNVSETTSPPPGQENIKNKHGIDKFCSLTKTTCEKIGFFYKSSFYDALLNIFTCSTYTFSESGVTC